MKEYRLRYMLPQAKILDLGDWMFHSRPQRGETVHLRCCAFVLTMVVREVIHAVSDDDTSCTIVQVWNADYHELEDFLSHREDHCSTQISIG